MSRLHNHKQDQLKESCKNSSNQNIQSQEQQATHLNMTCDHWFQESISWNKRWTDDL